MSNKNKDQKVVDFVRPTRVAIAGGNPIGLGSAFAQYLIRNYTGDLHYPLNSKESGYPSPRKNKRDIYKNK